MKAMLAFLPLVLLANPSSAEVKRISEVGFEVSESVTIQAPPGKVFASLFEVGNWWSSEHTISGDAHNLHIDMKAGGCFCETTVDGGSRLHMTVVALRIGVGPVTSLQNTDG